MNATKEKKKLINENGIRGDGRQLDEMRPIKMQVGVLKRADGSAYIEHGNNKILVGVYGPRELHPKHLAYADRLRIRTEYRLATFSVQERKSPAPKRREIELSKVIMEALEPSVFVEKFPRASVDVYIQVLDADGGTRCASITAASLALADAGLPLKGLVSAVAAGKVDGKVVLDLYDAEDKEGDGDLPVAVVSYNKHISLCQMDGDFTPDEVKQGIELAMKGCEKIYEIQCAALKKNYEDIEKEIRAAGPITPHEEEESSELTTLPSEEEEGKTNEAGEANEAGDNNGRDNNGEEDIDVQDVIPDEEEDEEAAADNAINDEIVIEEDVAGTLEKEAAAAANPQEPKKDEIVTETLEINMDDIKVKSDKKPPENKEGEDFTFHVSDEEQKK